MEVKEDDNQERRISGRREGTRRHGGSDKTRQAPGYQVPLMIEMWVLLIICAHLRCNEIRLAHVSISRQRHVSVRATSRAVASTHPYTAIRLMTMFTPCARPSLVQNQARTEDAQPRVNTAWLFSAPLASRERRTRARKLNVHAWPLARARLLPPATKSAKHIYVCEDMLVCAPPYIHIPLVLILV